MDDKKQTILLVEDDPSVREFLNIILKKDGFDVLACENGEEGCRLYERHGAELSAIVSDLRMPKMDGLAFAEYNYEHRFLPFVVCTAQEDAHTALKFLSLGVKDYIVKPIERRKLVEVVKNAIRRRHFDVVVEDDSDPYAGNVGSVIIPSKMAELQRALRWVDKKVRKKIGDDQSARFLNYVREFLLNAHEHGNLRIDVDEKARLIDAGTLSAELEAREKLSTAKIRLDLSVLDDQAAISITDDGYGFDYATYLNMSEEGLVARLERPNGRGIFMAVQYFDDIVYSKGGASVMLVKKFAS